MKKNTGRTSSLNDLTEADEYTTNLFNKPSLNTSWTFSNLLSSQDDNGNTSGGGNTFIGKQLKGSEENKETSNFAGSRDYRSKEGSLLIEVQNRLANHIKQTLIFASNSSDEKLLEELFYSLCSAVPLSLTKRLGLDTERRCYYYEILAAHYYYVERKQPGQVEQKLLPLCQKLWSFDHFAAIFALLFHRWLIQTKAGYNSNGWVMRFNVFLRGTFQLFWFDVRHETHRIIPLYRRLRRYMFNNNSPFCKPSSSDGVHSLETSNKDISVEETMLRDIPVEDGMLDVETTHSTSGQIENDRSNYSESAQRETIRKDFSYVLCRFYYYYTTHPEWVSKFCVEELQLEEGVDMFVKQLVVQLRAIKVRFMPFSFSSKLTLQTDGKCSKTIP